MGIMTYFVRKRGVEVLNLTGALSEGGVTKNERKLVEEEDWS